MSNYKYKNLMKIVSNMFAKDDQEKLNAFLAEIDEVYRKAEAFDTLLHTYEQYKESHTHDLKSTMGTKAIELLEDG